MVSSVLQVINAEGRVVASDPVWFPEDADLGPEALTIVSVLGAQASGKSTLLNHVLGTEFSVAARGVVGSATTKGVAAAKAADSPLVVALDVEGSDSRERGRAGRVFQARCAGLVASVSDVILLNLWYHDVGRLDATGYTLLEAVFAEAVKIAAPDPNCFKTALVFVIRDIDDDADVPQLEKLLMDDAADLYASCAGVSAVPIDDLFEFSVVALPHMRHHTDEFQNACATLGARITNREDPDFLGKTEFSKSIPADGCGTFTHSLWESLYTTARSAPNTGASAGLEGGEPLLAAYRCDEAFSEALQEASTKMADFSHQTLDDGEKIESFGAKSAEIMNNALSAYDDSTQEFVDESIQSRKRRELEAIIDTSQHAIFMKQVQVLRENALAHFKSATASDDMPSDFAFYTADSLFQREVEDSKRPGSGWNANQERSDLQNMMQEISTQRKRLLTSQVTAAQQQAHAMQYLQMQQSQMNAMQAQAYGGSAGQWNIGAAYRPPDTNINASFSHAQGRSNIQISMVPDESASLLGPSGFVASGLAGGNLGLSFNIGL